MEIEQLRAAWSELNEKTEKNATLLADVRKELKLEKARAKLRWFLGAPIFELVVGMIGPLLLGPFLFDGPHSAKFVIPALFLDLVAIAMVGTSIWQIATLGSLDYSAPVIDVQRKLLLVRKVRILSTQWILLIAPLLWMPMVIVGLEGLIRLDVYRAFGTAYVVSNIAFGIAFIPAAYWIARKAKGKLQGTPFLASLLDGLGGRGLSAAAKELGEISNFEKA